MVAFNSSGVIVTYIQDLVQTTVSPGLVPSGVYDTMTHEGLKLYIDTYMPELNCMVNMSTNQYYTNLYMALNGMISEQDIKRSTTKLMIIPAKPSTTYTVVVYPSTTSIYIGSNELYTREIKDYFMTNVREFTILDPQVPVLYTSSANCQYLVVQVPKDTSATTIFEGDFTNDIYSLEPDRSKRTSLNIPIADYFTYQTFSPKLLPYLLGYPVTQSSSPEEIMQMQDYLVNYLGYPYEYLVGKFDDQMRDFLKVYQGPSGRNQTYALGYFDAETYGSLVKSR